MNRFFSIIVTTGVPPAEIAVVGLTSANIKFRIGTWGAGELVVETITVTEIGGGVYVCSGFTVYQDVKLFIDGIEQTWFGIQKAGIDSNGIAMLTGNQTIAGVKTFSSFPVTPSSAPTTDYQVANKKYVADSGSGFVTLTTTQSITGKKTFHVGSNTTADPAFKITQSSNPANGDIIGLQVGYQSTNKMLFDFGNSEIIGGNFNLNGNYFPLSTYKLIVDPNATPITGKVYNTPSAAITYANATASINKQFLIMILPSNTGSYNESLGNVNPYVHLFGIGKIVIAGNFVLAGTRTDYVNNFQNIVFDSTALSMSFLGLKALNCVFKVNGSSGEINFLFYGLQAEGCGFYVQGSNNIETDAPAKIKANRIINCFGNADIGWDFVNGTPALRDKIYSYSFIVGDLISD